MVTAAQILLQAAIAAAMSVIVGCVCVNQGKVIMTVKGVLWRFTLAYIAALVLVGYTLNYFGIKGGSGINTAILMGCIFWVCSAFAKANKRYFTASEKTAVVLGLILIDIVFQWSVSWLVLSQKHPSSSPGGALLFATLFIGTLHAILIYFLVGAVKKSLVKQGIVEG